jgi:hypothetical protein
VNPELDKLDADRQTPPSFQLELTAPEINVIFAALAELPHRVADPIMRKLFAQTQKPAE